MSYPTRPTEFANRRVLGSRALDFSEIPMIDLAPMRGADEGAKRRLTEAVRDVCCRVGFFYVKNHGVPDVTVEEALGETERFFALPSAVKLRYDIARIGRHRGFVPVGALTADPDTEPDRQEGYEVALELPEDDPDYLAGSKLYGPNVWPREVPEFAPKVYRYFESVRELGHLLFRAFALALELPEAFFEPEITKPTAQLRLIYYPAGHDDGVKLQNIGIGAHTDYECFTILWQNAPGLQVQNRSNEWVEAPPIPGTFVVNIGDMMQRWTNDMFRSTPHRVINPPGRERYSFPFFFGANHGTIVRPLGSCCGPDNPPRYPPTHFGYWVENMHAYSYVYRHEERGILPNPELE